MVLEGGGVLMSSFISEFTKLAHGYCFKATLHALTFTPDMTP